MQESVSHGLWVVCIAGVCMHRRGAVAAGAAFLYVHGRAQVASLYLVDLSSPLQKPASILLFSYPSLTAGMVAVE